MGNELAARWPAAEVLHFEVKLSASVWLVWLILRLRNEAAEAGHVAAECHLLDAQRGSRFESGGRGVKLIDECPDGRGVAVQIGRGSAARIGSTASTKS